MKKVCAAALVATLLAGTAASAQDIRPLEATASTQGQFLGGFFAGIPVPVLLIGTVVTIGAIAIFDGDTPTDASGPNS